MKTLYRKIWETYQKYRWGINLIVIIALIFGVPVSLSSSWFSLYENQSLYLFSTMAQVVAGLFGLTLTAYVFFADKLRAFSQKEDDYYEAVDTLLSQYFRNLIIVAVVCWTSFFFSVFAIIMLSQPSAIYNYFVKQSTVLFFASITLILAFGVAMLDPKKLAKETTRQKLEAERRYTLTEPKTQADLGEFLRTYNQLEQLIIDFAGELVRNDQRNVTGFRPRILESMAVLGMHEIIYTELRSNIDELRRYRNGLVHGTDLTVSVPILNRLTEIYQDLETIHTMFMENDNLIPYSSEWDEAVRKLNG